MAVPASQGDQLLSGLDGNAITLALLTQALRSLDGPDVAEVVAVEIVTEFKQSNAHGGVLRLSLADSSEPRHLFLKKATAAGQAQKEWVDRRRALAYARTEARFYQEFLNNPEVAGRLAQAQVRTPRLALCENTLDSALGDSPVHAVSGDEPPTEALLHSGSILFMEYAKDFIQTSPITEQQAVQALRAVAGLHAAGWQHEKTLRSASQRLQRIGGSYTLEIRNPAELKKIRPNWDNFVFAFGLSAPTLFERPGVTALGERLERWTQWVARQLSPGPGDAYATLVHGDLKAMNVMLSKTPDGEAMLIDFANTGVGFAMVDVAMLLSHSLTPQTLADGGQERLLDAYLDALAKRGVTNYPKPTALRHFHLATVDYMRFMVSRFWSGASPDAFAKRAENPNVTLPNRNVEAALRFAERADASLRFLEEEGLGP